jgi:hypothetical protein
VTEELVPGPTAAQYDVGSRLAWLAVAILIIVWVALASAGSLAVVPVGVVALAGIASAIGLGVRSSRVVRLEKTAGYSTLFDFAGFALRHPRTKQLLRAADVEPENLGRRSVLVSMLTVKPGTLLAKQLRDDE